MSDLVPACPYSEEQSWANLRAGQKCGKGTFLGISQYTTLGLHPWAPSGQVSKSWFIFMTEQYSTFRLVQMKLLWQLYKGFCEDITFHFSTVNICWCNCWVLLGFQVAQWWSACQCRRHRFDPWVGKIPWRRKWLSTPIFSPGKSHGLRSLMCYSPWGCKELDMT